MTQIILDFSGGNTHKNDWKYLKRMLDELKKVDTGKHEIIIKHQLFIKAGDNIPLKREIFKKAYDYAKKLEYKTTSSVFDKESLDFLLQFDIPFVKIANNRKLDYLIGEIPRKIPVYVSKSKIRGMSDYGNNINSLCCVSKYPCVIEDYEKIFKTAYLISAISDHTTDFELWHKYEPQIIEWHYVLEYDENNLDGGLFARTPSMLKEIL